MLLKIAFINRRIGKNLQEVSSILEVNIMKTAESQKFQLLNSSFLIVGVITIAVIIFNWPICSKYLTQLYLDLLNELQMVSSDPYSFF